MESDRTNIFGAIRSTQRGFDGLSDALRKPMATWLVDACVELIERQRPGGRLSAAQLEAEQQAHGTCSMCLTRLLDRLPWLPMLLLLTVVGSLCTVVWALAALFDGGYNYEEAQTLFALATWPLGIICVSLPLGLRLREHQSTRRLRQPGALLGLRRCSSCPDVMFTCYANYVLAASLTLALAGCGVWWGYQGCAVWFYSFAVIVAVQFLIIAPPRATAATQSDLLAKAGWLQLEVGMAQDAKRSFAAAERTLRDAVGARGSAGGTTFSLLRHRCGTIAAMRACGEVRGPRAGTPQRPPTVVASSCRLLCKASHAF